MNDIRKTIGYADFSWNPVTGCLHGCEYCYARGIAERFRRGTATRLGGDLYQAWEGAIFPNGFRPTFYHHRLDEPARKRKPSTIFVCDMADLFGDWVPQEWQEAVFNACEAAPQHRYLFLTKNPARMSEAVETSPCVPFDSWWFGTTVTNQADLQKDGIPWATEWISFEPLLGPINLNKDTRRTKRIICWAVIGGLNHAKRPKNTVKWAADLIEQLRDADIPIWVKGDLYGIFPYHETPWEV